MLPDVDSEERHESRGGLQRILIGAGGDAQPLGGGVEGEPSPSGALDGDSGGAEFVLHGLEGAEVALDGGLEASLGLAAAGREVLPEDGVIDVPAAVESNGGLESDGGGDVSLRQRLRSLLLGDVEIVDVGGVVLGVMQLHDLSRNRGLQCSEVVRQIRQTVLASRRSSHHRHRRPQSSNAQSTASQHVVLFRDMEEMEEEAERTGKGDSRGSASQTSGRGSEGRLAGAQTREVGIGVATPALEREVKEGGGRGESRAVQCRG